MEKILFFSLASNTRRTGVDFSLAFDHFEEWEIPLLFSFCFRYWFSGSMYPHNLSGDWAASQAQDLYRIRIDLDYIWRF